MSDPILSLHGIRKNYGPVRALDGVDFAIMPGEIVSLVGDNGAGKSTLVKIMSGAVQPSAGQIRFEGTPVVFASPHDARDAGIETVYQDLAVVPELDAEANLFLGREWTGTGLLSRFFLDRKRMRAAAEAHIRSLKVNLKSIRQPVGLLSGGQRQSVAVARSILWGRKVIILDEPTAALGVRESRGVLDLILELRARNFAVLMVSHSMPHVFEVSDRIFVLRQGRSAAVLDRHGTTMNEIVGLITGIPVSADMTSAE
ncbi:MAG: sugar ABC transporter ATP-binding protein [Acidiphilium sp. 37-64-53]|jgi:ABC-type sugar transport system ATPase subunit|uniref:ATP-binding cassette domain-containing protein n=1 Tax=Acidiphilium TaxID=522 RepID=UPI000BC8CC7D|nr:MULTISPECIES: ATP-binding cassette domain-containing protein [Acidiphilium]OYW00195.1 MAG: sugar ABC transporter ATP-binding protein [Acidiphilium sp. 37-64-53]OZB28201.1 MAG: sugar ABC transporter ATP-binding protein [Acidiphilium sp. 34-64-41]HQT86230.1 ATP-binding cassette domain-containing protein [Acidiphilium rubrum]